MSNGESAERARHRSPSYPFISLDEAIEKARVIYQRDQRHSTSTDVAVTYWGYKPTTSNGKLCIAALKKFGLLDDVGGGKSGQVRLSRLALDIVLLDDQEHQAEKLKAIQEAALMPKIHAELWEKWGPDLPSDATMRASLIREWDFNDTYVGGFIKQYRRTITFAKLDETPLLAKMNGGDIIGDGADDNEAASLEPHVEKKTVGPMGTVQSPTRSPMPAIPAPPVGAGPSNTVDLLYPLFGDEFAALRVTKPLSHESFELLKDYLELLGKTLVRKESKPVPQQEKQEGSPTEAGAS